MSRQFWQETLAWATADGTAVASTTTETSIFSDITIPANYMSDGRLLRMRAFGRLSNTASATITFAIRWGGAAGTLLAQSEAITPGAAVTNVCWSIEALIQTRSNGSSGSLFVMADVSMSLTASTSFSQTFGVSGFDAPAVVSALNLAADTALALTADWSANSASNTLTGHMYHLESMN